MESGPLATEELARFTAITRLFGAAVWPYYRRMRSLGYWPVRPQSISRPGSRYDLPLCWGQGRFSSGHVPVWMYPEMASPAATAGLCQDLRAFVAEQPSMGSNFATFIASFTGPQPEDWSHFDVRIRRQLQCLRDMDSYEYDRETRPTPSHCALRSALRDGPSSSSSFTPQAPIGPVVSPGPPWSSTPATNLSVCARRESSRDFSRWSKRENVRCRRASTGVRRSQRSQHALNRLVMLPSG